VNQTSSDLEVEEQEAQESRANHYGSVFIE